MFSVWASSFSSTETEELGTETELFGTELPFINWYQALVWLESSAANKQKHEMTFIDKIFRFDWKSIKQWTDEDSIGDEY